MNAFITIIILCVCIYSSLTVECSVLELYVHRVGGQKLHAALLGAGALPSGVTLFSMWTHLLPMAVNTLLSQLYPDCYSEYYVQMYL